MTLKDFEEKVMKDENLRLQVEQTQSLSEFVKIANENGVNVTKEGLMNEVVKYRGMHDMNDQELEAVSGGSLRDFWDGFKFGFCRPILAVEFLIELAKRRPGYFEN